MHMIVAVVVTLVVNEGQVPILLASGTGTDFDRSSLDAAKRSLNVMGFAPKANKVVSDEIVFEPILFGVSG